MLSQSDHCRHHSFHAWQRRGTSWLRCWNSCAIPRSWEKRKAGRPERGENRKVGRIPNLDIGIQCDMTAEFAFQEKIELTLEMVAPTRAPLWRRLARRACAFGARPHKLGKKARAYPKRSPQVLQRGRAECQCTPATTPTTHRVTTRGERGVLVRTMHDASRSLSV
jgi:hypothetical protein